MRIVRIFGIAFITGFSGAMMPGPMLVLTIGQTGVHGMAAVWAIVGGHAVLEIATVLLLVAGMRHVLQRPALRGAISLIGGAFLAWMGADMMRNAAAASLDLARSAQGMPWLQLIIAGAAVCVVNPYFTLWWATVGGGQLAHAAPRNAVEYISFYAGHELSDLVWFALVGLIVVTGATWLSPTVYSWLIVVCGAALIALSLWFIWTGARLVWEGAGDESAGGSAAEMVAEAGAPADADSRE
ncbi:MAG: LysE family transporter [Armatimonadota bacterium]|nr:LysE family transporter [Armatimonadota bacterium]